MNDRTNDRQTDRQPISLTYCLRVFWLHVVAALCCCNCCRCCGLNAVIYDKHIIKNKSIIASASPFQFFHFCIDVCCCCCCYYNCFKNLPQVVPHHRHHHHHRQSATMDISRDLCKGVEVHRLKKSESKNFIDMATNIVVITRLFSYKPEVIRNYFSISLWPIFWILQKIARRYLIVIKFMKKKKIIELLRIKS